MAQGDKYEKAFSEVAKKWLKNVTPDKRKAMLPLTVKQCVFLRENLVKVNYHY